MIKFNRNNHNFQIANFIAGSCHTPDAAYIALITQKSDREHALHNAEVEVLKRQAKLIQINRDLKSDDEAVKLMAQAELMEFTFTQKQMTELVDAGKDELKFINECIEKIKPLRKYAHLSDAEAAEACQAEEWLGELKYRAENYLITQGTIPPDHFATMRQHPDFKLQLLPHIEQVQQGIQSKGITQFLLESKDTNLLLENK